MPPKNVTHISHATIAASLGDTWPYPPRLAASFIQNRFYHYDSLAASVGGRFRYDAGITLGPRQCTRSGEETERYVWRPIPPLGDAGYTRSNRQCVSKCR